MFCDYSVIKSLNSLNICMTARHTVELFVTGHFLRTHFRGIFSTKQTLHLTCSEWGTSTISIIVHSNCVSILAEITDNRRSYVIVYLDLRGHAGVRGQSSCSHRIRRSLLDIVNTLTFERHVTLDRLCIRPASQGGHGCVSSSAALVVGTCGCRRRGDRRKGDVVWRKLCWALIKACLGASANCCGFCHKTGVERRCPHYRDIL